MATVPGVTNSSFPCVFSAPEIWFARLLIDLSGSSNNGWVILAALENACIGVERTRKGRLRPLPQELDDFDVNFREKAATVFRSGHAFVPDSDQWTGAFVPAWLPSCKWSDALGVFEQIRSELDSCVHPSPKPVFMALAETPLAAIKLIRLASAGQIVVPDRLWEKLTDSEVAIAEKMRMHPPELENVSLAFQEQLDEFQSIVQEQQILHESSHHRKLPK